MKKSKFNPNEIARILKEFDQGKSPEEINRDYGISRAALYKWRQRYGGMEATELKRVKEQVQPALGIELKLVQLMGDDEDDYGWMLAPGGMQELARYADGIGPEKGMIISADSTPGNLIISTLVQDAHEAGLQVHPYTFRADPGQVPAYARDFNHLLELFYVNAGVDGVFTDFPDKAVEFLKNQ